MGIDDVPSELRAAADAALSEFRAACADGSGTLGWLGDYEVLELRAPGFVGEQDLEVYMPRPLLEDLKNLGPAERKQVLEELRAIPGRALGGAGHRWVIGEQGRVRALERRPFI